MVHQLINERQALCPRSSFCSGQAPWNHVTRSFSKAKHSFVARWVSRESKLRFCGLCAYLSWFGIWVNERYRWYSTSKMVLKSIHVGMKVVIPIKYWYLVGLSRWENLCMSELVFGSESFKTTVLSRYEGSCMLHKSEWCQKQKCLHIPISCGYQVLWNPHYRYPNDTTKPQY